MFGGFIGLIQRTGAHFLKLFTPYYFDKDLGEKIYSVKDNR